LAQAFLVAVLRDLAEAVDGRHHQVLQDHGRLQLQRGVQRFGGVGHVVEFDVGLVAQHAPHGFDDDQLIVHQQHSDLEDRQGRLLICCDYICFGHQDSLCLLLTTSTQGAAQDRSDLRQR
jgi:hypothetical protein